MRAVPTGTAPNDGLPAEGGAELLAGKLCPELSLRNRERLAERMCSGLKRESLTSGAGTDVSTHETSSRPVSAGRSTPGAGSVTGEDLECSIKLAEPGRERAPPAKPGRWRSRGTGACERPVPLRE